MVDGIIAGAVVLVVIVGLWLTRNAKGRGGPPGSVARNAAFDHMADRLGQGEAFKDEKPEDY
jgi:hypothetical protein